MIARALRRYLGQALAYAAFGGAIAYLSTSPAYVHFPDDQAMIRLSFSHAGQRREKCRQRSAEELAQLAPNMRTPLDCARERASVAIRFEMDGRLLYAETLAPSGLSRDGASTVYRRIPVPAGSHRLLAQLGDGADGGFNYQREEVLILKPAQVVVVDFKADAGGFIFR